MVIYFNVPEVREYLIKNGKVFTLRKPRRTGHDIAVYGSYYKHEIIGDVDITLVLENVDNPNILCDDLSCDYFDESGFTRENSGPYEWLELARKLSGNRLNLYRVDLFVYGTAIKNAMIGLNPL